MLKKLLWILGIVIIIALAVSIKLGQTPKTPVENGQPKEMGQEIVIEEEEGLAEPDASILDEEGLAEEDAGLIAEEELFPEPEEISASNLEGSWKISLLIDGPKKLDLTNHDFFLNFEESHVSGKICNNLGGPYELIADNQLAFGALIRTQMYCFENMEAEDTFFDIIQSGQLNYVIDGTGSLILTDGSSKIIELSR